MTSTMIRGILTREGNETYILGADGKRYFQDVPIWEGYLTHWQGKDVCARALPQKDYLSNSPIVIMWPYQPPQEEPFIELYYNERLVKYWASFLGHLAINVNEEIFNFSHLMNENEVMTRGEYFYRPALGEFGPSPRTGRFDVDEEGRVYYDKFGRNFMRTIHAVRVVGLDTEKLSKIFHRELEIIRNTPPHPKHKEKYRDFNVFTRSCVTIIRDGLQRYEFRRIKGTFPRDLFISAVHEFQRTPGLRMNQFTMSQLKVPEAATSALTPCLNVRNYFRSRIIR